MTAWGLDRAGTKGTTPQEMQQIIRSMYAVYGILSGCEMTASASGMTLQLVKGAVVLPVAGDRAVIGATPTVTIPLDPAPATGEDEYDILATITDAPGEDIRILVIKNRSQAIPQWVCRLDTFMLPAGASSASQGYFRMMKEYAIPTGSGRGELLTADDKTPFGTLAKREPYNIQNAEFYLPQDRRLEFRLAQSFSAQQGSPEGSFQWVIRDSIHGLVTSPVLRYDAWQSGQPITGSTSYFSHTANFSAGRHVVSWNRQQITGSYAVHVGGQAPQAQGLVWRPWNRIQVLDAGITR